jgi:hypothetical protein
MASSRPQIKLPLKYWLEEILKELPTAKRSNAEQVDDNDWVKMALEFELPLKADSVPKTGLISGPYRVHHLQLTLDITNVLHFAEQGDQTVCVLPYKTFPVTTKPDATKGMQIELIQTQVTEINEAYRSYIYQAVQMMKRFPDISELDIDICGRVPAGNSSVRDAIITNNMPLLNFARENGTQRLMTITVQGGESLDLYQYVSEATKNRKAKKSWQLMETFRFQPLHGVDPMDLFAVRDILRGELAVRVWPTFKAPAGPRQVGSAALAAKLDVERTRKDEDVPMPDAEPEAIAEAAQGVESNGEFISTSELRLANQLIAIAEPAPAGELMLTLGATSIAEAVQRVESAPNGMFMSPSELKLPTEPAAIVAPALGTEHIPSSEHAPSAEQAPEPNTVPSSGWTTGLTPPPVFATEAKESKNAVAEGVAPGLTEKKISTPPPTSDVAEMESTPTPMAAAGPPQFATPNGQSKEAATPDLTPDTDDRKDSVSVNTPLTPVDDEFHDLFN